MTTKGVFVTRKAVAKLTAPREPARLPTRLLLLIRHLLQIRRLLQTLRLHLIQPLSLTLSG